jgi:hypothetical protein
VGCGWESVSVVYLRRSLGLQSGQREDDSQESQDGENHRGKHRHHEAKSTGRRFTNVGAPVDAQFNDGKPVAAAGLGGCFACHVPVKDRDFLFTRYAP